MRTPKENKQKLRDRTLKSAAGTIPKAALKAVWLKTKDQAVTAARENDTESRQQEPTDFAGSAAEQSASFVWHQGRKFAETQARQHRQKEAATHAAGERGVSPKQAECGTLPDAAQRPHRGADLPRQRAKEKAYCVGMPIGWSITNSVYWQMRMGQDEKDVTKPFSDEEYRTMVGEALSQMWDYLEYHVYDHWEISIQEFLMEVAIVEDFTVYMAEMITGRNDVESLLERIQ